MSDQKAAKNLYSYLGEGYQIKSPCVVGDDEYVLALQLGVRSVVVHAYGFRGTLLTHKAFEEVGI